MNTITPSKISSRISPLLGAIAYPLGNQFVLPYYFDHIFVTGQHHIPKRSPVILAPTHRSRWDALIVAHATGKGVTGRYLRFMVSADEMKGVQGWFIRQLGGFPVDTRRTRRTKMASVDHTIELLHRGQMVVIFPEGNIFRDTQVQPIKRGVAKIALDAQAQRASTLPPVQIVPIDLHYSDPIPHRGTAVRVTIGQPLAAADYSSDSVKAGSKQLTQDLTAALQSLGSRVGREKSAPAQ